MHARVLILSDVIDQVKNFLSALSDNSLCVLKGRVDSLIHESVHAKDPKDLSVVILDLHLPSGFEGDLDMVGIDCGGCFGHSLR